MGDLQSDARTVLGNSFSVGKRLCLTQAKTENPEGVNQIVQREKGKSLGDLHAFACDIDACVGREEISELREKRDSPKKPRATAASEKFRSDALRAGIALSLLHLPLRV